MGDGEKALDKLIEILAKYELDIFLDIHGPLL